MTNKNEVKSKNGMPDIAESGGSKKPVLIMIFGAALILIMGGYFVSLMHSVKSVQSQAEETYTVQSVAVEHKAEQAVAAPAPSTVPETAPTPPVNPEVIQQQIALIQEKQKELQQRLAAPLMVVNQGQSSHGNDSTVLTQKPKEVSSDANTQFMQQVSAQNTEIATVSSIGSLSDVIAEGSLIHAILESATNSDLPGMLRASVSEAVYSEDGSQVLIPPGSRLIGQYKSGLSQGQSRIFVVWTRLITPQGLSIQLGSPGVDSLGVAGMNADEINRHFWERFGSASLLSLIGAGAANVGENGQDQPNSASSYREAVATSFAQSASQSLQQDSRIAPTLKIVQGKPIMVFVAKDLHFQSTMKSTKSKFNVF